MLYAFWSGRSVRPRARNRTTATATSTQTSTTTASAVQFESHQSPRNRSPSRVTASGMTSGRSHAGRTNGAATRGRRRRIRLMRVNLTRWQWADPGRALDPVAGQEPEPEAAVTVGGGDLDGVARVDPTPVLELGPDRPSRDVGAPGQLVLDRLPVGRVVDVAEHVEI